MSVIPFKSIRRIPIFKEQPKYNVLNPAKEVLIGTDTLNRKTFRQMTEKAMRCMLNDKQMSKILETETHKINGEYKEIKATTKFWFEVAEDCDITKNVNLTSTDQWVLGACMAEIQQGNFVTTADIIYRNCGGVGDPSPKKVEEILKSVDKMMSLKIYIDATDTKQKLQQLHRKYGDEFKTVVVGNVLPASYCYTTLNGVPNTVTITLHEISPLFKYAMAKGQITDIPSKLLTVPQRKNTPYFLELKGYLNIRIQAIKRTRKYNPRYPAVITMENMIKHCGFQSNLENKHFRKRMWQDITLYMEFLIDNKIITGFQCLTKDNKIMKKWQDNGKITFTYSTDCGETPR